MIGCGDDDGVDFVVHGVEHSAPVGEFASPIEIAKDFARAFEVDIGDGDDVLVTDISVTVIPLPADSDAERARLLIATGFLAFGTKGLNEMNRWQFFASDELFSRSCPSGVLSTCSSLSR